MQLYKINAEINMLCNNFQDSEEELDYLFRRLEELQIEKETKVLNICKLIKNINVDVEALKAEEKALNERRKVAENQINNLKRYLCNNAENVKIKDAQASLSWRKSESVYVGGEVPEAYQRVKIEPDKTKIKSALKNGEAVDNCSLVASNNPVIK